MTKRILIGFNWLAGGLLSVALLMAALMPADFFNKEDWAKPVVLIVLAIGLLIIINGIKNVTSKMSDRAYRYCLYAVATLIIILQAWVALHFIDAARADAYFVRNQAIALAQGSHKWNYYFKVYPNNVNTALFEGGLIKILFSIGVKSPWTILNVFRFIWIDTGLLSGLIILRNWKNWRPSALLFMLSWLVSAPIYAYGIFPYNDALVMPLVLNIAALGWLFVNKHGWQRWLAGICTWILLSMGYVMKSNLVVLLIAVLMTVVFAVIIRKCDLKLALEWLSGCLVTLVLVLGFMNMASKQSGYTKDTELATPVTSWIAMSLNPDKQGQYNGNDFFPIRNTKTQDAKRKKASNLIKSRAQKMGKIGLLEHFYQKMGVFFSHGDFDAINLTSQWIETPSGYMQKQRYYKFWILVLTQSWYLALLFGSIWQLFVQRKHLLTMSLFSLVLIGLTAFHVLIWEVEPRYSLPLLPITMLLGCEGWSTIPEMALNLKRRLIISWVMTLGMIVAVFNIAQMSEKIKITQVSVSSQGIGSYFTPNTLKIDSTYQFRVNSQGAKSNQIVLHSGSQNRVTVIVKNKKEVLAHVTGRANRVQRINYPTTQATVLNIIIVNHGRLPVSYKGGLLSYSVSTGKVLRKLQMNMQWNVNHVFSRSSKQHVIKLTPLKTVVKMLTMYLLFIILSIWYYPKNKSIV